MVPDGYNTSIVAEAGALDGRYVLLVQSSWPGTRLAQTINTSGDPLGRYVFSFQVRPLRTSDDVETYCYVGLNSCYDADDAARPSCVAGPAAFWGIFGDTWQTTRLLIDAPWNRTYFEFNLQSDQSSGSGGCQLDNFKIEPWSEVGTVGSCDADAALENPSFETGSISPWLTAYFSDSAPDSSVVAASDALDGEYVLRSADISQSSLPNIPLVLAQEVSSCASPFNRNTISVGLKVVTSDPSAASCWAELCLQTLDTGSLVLPFCTYYSVVAADDAWHRVSHDYGFTPSGPWAYHSHDVILNGGCIQGSGDTHFLVDDFRIDTYNLV